MNTIKSDVENLVQKELESANQRFPMFRSDHEGAAVIYEEMQKNSVCKSCLRSNPSSSYGAEVHRQPEREKIILW